MTKIPEAHLGDGCYVSFDGYHLWLAANHHENKLIALDPDVMRALVDYARRIDARMGTRYFDVDGLR